MRKAWSPREEPDDDTPAKVWPSLNAMSDAYAADAELIQRALHRHDSLCSHGHCPGLPEPCGGCCRCLGGCVDGMDPEPPDDDVIVCVTHMAFVPCRRPGPCRDSTDPSDIERVREYQLSDPNQPLNDGADYRG